MSGVEIFTKMEYKVGGDVIIFLIRNTNLTIHKLKTSQGVCLL